MATEDNVTKRIRIKGDEEYVTLIYPGNFSMMFGGTRTFNPATHLNRWWQYATRIEEGRKHFPCQLHSRAQNVIFPEIPVGDGFTLIRNSNTPHHDHRLYFPFLSCWPEYKIRKLGGISNLAGLLGHAMQMMRDEHHEYVRMICYVGQLSGMNQQDFHAHYLVNPDNCDPELPIGKLFDLDAERALHSYWRNKSEMVILDGDVRVVCDSIFRAGQCFLVSKKDVSSDCLAAAINELLLMFENGFTSLQGLAPDFKLMLEFQNGRFDWGYYSPCLNPHGVEEEAPRTGVHVHPWGPAETLKILRGSK